MEEYNINNIQKINSINFINLGNNKIPIRSKSPLYNNLEQIDYQLKSPSYTGLTNKERNLMKLMNYNSNKSYKKNKDPFSNNNTEVKYIKINQNKIPHSLPFYHSKAKTKTKNESFEIKNKMHNKLFKKDQNDDNDQSYQQSVFNSLNNKSFNNHPFIKNNNKGIYNTNLSYQKNDSDDNNDLILKSKYILYEKQINDLKNQNQNLLNKLKAYIKDIKIKKNEINNLNLKNKNLQNELNKISMNKMNQSENSNTNTINNKNSYQDQQIASKINIPKNLMKSNEFISSKKFITDNNNLNDNKLLKAQSENTKMFTSSDAYAKTILERKNNEIKMLYQKNKQLSKDLELVTNKNGNLSKLLTRKNLDLIEYQKSEIEKEKKIEELTKLLEKSTSENMKNDNNMTQKKIEENKLIKEINYLKNVIKSKISMINKLNGENKGKSKQIEELFKKLNEMGKNIKEKNLEDKENISDIQIYKNIILQKENDLKDITNKFNNLEKEKNDIINNMNNREKEYNINKNIIIELNDQLKKYKNIIEQKNNEINEYKSSKQELLNQMKNKVNITKENDILIKKLEQLSNENKNLTDQINDITNRYQTQKKLLSERSIEIDNMKKEKKISNDINPNICTIITNKRYKKLEWYLLHKNPNKHQNDAKEVDGNYDNYIWVSNLVLKNEDLKNYNKFENENDKNKELNEYVFNLQQKLEKKEESINKLDYQNKKLANQLHNKTANMKGNVLLKKDSKDENYANSFNMAENEMKYKNILEKLNYSNKREKQLNNQITLLKEKLIERDNLEKNFPHDMKHIDPHLHDSGFLDDDSEENKNTEIKNILNEENKVEDINDKNINNNLGELNNNKNEEEIKDKNDNDNDVLNKNIEKMDLNDNFVDDEGQNKSKVSSKNDPFKESEKIVDEFLMKGAGDEDDYDEIKIITKQMNFLKEEIKENREKYKKLGNEISDLLTKIKCNDKNRKNIVQICQLLSFTPDNIEQIISNKKYKK